MYVLSGVNGQETHFILVTATNFQIMSGGCHFGSGNLRGYSRHFLHACMRYEAFVTLRFSRPKIIQGLQITAGSTFCVPWITQKDQNLQVNWVSDALSGDLRIRVAQGRHGLNFQVLREGFQDSQRDTLSVLWLVVSIHLLSTSSPFLSKCLFYIYICIYMYLSEEHNNHNSL